MSDNDDPKFEKAVVRSKQLLSQNATQAFVLATCTSEGINFTVANRTEEIDEHYIALLAMFDELSERTSVSREEFGDRFRRELEAEDDTTQTQSESAESDTTESNGPDRLFDTLDANSSVSNGGGG